MRASRQIAEALTATAVAIAVAITGCAWGNAEWRRSSYATTVELRGAGDGRCSSPAPWTSLRACLEHDLAYEYARRARCAGRESAEHTSEQARYVADLTLAQKMAVDGYGELWTTIYYLAVRMGGWWSWHFAPCGRDPPTPAASAGPETPDGTHPPVRPRAPLRPGLGGAPRSRDARASRARARAARGCSRISAAA